MDISQNRLAIYLPTLVGGGAERVFLNLAKGFVDHGYSVDFILAQREGTFMRQVPDCVRLIVLNPFRLKAGRSIFSLPALARYIRRERPLAMLTALHANIIAVWAKIMAGVPLQLVINEQNTFTQQNQMLPPGAQQIMLELVRKNYPLADQIIVVSEGAADDLARAARIPRERIRVIPNPIIIPELAELAGEYFHHPWFTPDEPPVILSVGRLDRQKDFSLLIKAFACVRKITPARLIILGEGPERVELAALVKQLGLEEDVSMPGFTQNPYPFMANASVFVLSSRWEGLPTVLVEALFCGAPIVATDCPSGPIEILKNGKYGRLVPVGDVDRLADAILLSITGNPIVPPQESWTPYKLDMVVRKYLQVMDPR
jgi:glycosyltransferase involved in cell wall biosynthesis